MEKVEKEVFLLDIDYVLTKEFKPVIRMFCKDLEGNNLVIYYKGFLPYFYVLVKEDLIPEFLEKLKKTRIPEAKIENIEILKKEFLGKEVKIVKITINNPRKIPKVRKFIKDNFNEVLETFEYDIPFYRRFLIDNNILPSGWLKVYGIKKDEKILAEKIENIEINKLPKLKIYAFDIEIFEEKDAEKIALISIVGNDGFKITLSLDFGEKTENVEIFKTEKELIKRFIEIIKEKDPDILVGYNTDGFDFPLLKEKAEKYGLELNIGKENSKIKTVKRGWVKSFKIPGRVYLDLYVFVDHILSPNIKTEVLTLDAVAKEFLGYGKKELTFEEMQLIFKQGIDIKKAIEYNVWDCELVLKLLDIFLPQMIALSKITSLSLFDVCRNTYSQLVEAYLLKNSYKDNQIAPNRPKHEELKIRRLKAPYKGAFVFEPKTGIHENIIVLDFKSLYPTIIVAHNISIDTFNCEHEICKSENKVPELNYHFCTLRKGFIPKHLEFLIDERARIKKLMKNIDKNSEEYKLLDALQYSLKILANATYGYLGYVGARWYKRECAESVTAFERSYIKKVAELAKSFNFEIIYGDTDSLMITSKLNKEDFIKAAQNFLNLVNSSLKSKMELEFRGFYVRGIFVKKREKEAGAKKRYALLSEDGSLEIRGFETVRRDWCKLAKLVQRNVLEIILKENDTKKAIEYVRNVIQKLRNFDFKLEDVTIYEQLTKNISEYKQISPHVIAAKKAMQRGIKISEGSIIPFVITKYGNSISEKAEYALFVKKEDVDVEYYISNQILPAALRVLSVLNITESDIIKGTKQTSLSKFFSNNI
ncbi:MAG: DNA-directed DNA polymerase [Candidatus Aenigmatarchaeota archaeon]